MNKEALEAATDTMEMHLWVRDYRKEKVEKAISAYLSTVWKKFDADKLKAGTFALLLKNGAIHSPYAFVNGDDRFYSTDRLQSKCIRFEFVDKICDLADLMPDLSDEGKIDVSK